MGSLNIPEYVTIDPISDNISDTVIKLIVKCRKHRSTLTISEKVLKNGRGILKLTMHQLVSCLMCLRYLNDACFAKSLFLSLPPSVYIYIDR